jgi:hypothetical protein
LEKAFRYFLGIWAFFIFSIFLPWRASDLTASAALSEVRGEKPQLHL